MQINAKKTVASLVHPPPGVTADITGPFAIRRFFCLFFLKFILFLAALGLHCFAQAFSSCGNGVYFLLRYAGFSLRWLLLLQSTGSRHASSVVVARGL